MKHRPFLKPMSQMSLMEQVTAIFAACSIFFALITMIAEWSSYAAVAGLVQMIMGTFAYYQQTQIRTMNIMEEKTNAIEKDVGRLSPENTKMTYTIDELEGRVDDLLDVEDALEVITMSQGSSVDTLEKDSEINLEILDQMPKSVQTSVIEILMSSILCREDTNDTISKEEVDAMVMLLKDISGLLTNEERLKRTIVGRPSESIIDAIQNLLDKDVLAQKKIFRIY
eukprot:jgi/Psemu1/188959/e_gw1.83.102.1